MQKLSPVEEGSSSTTDGPQKSIGLERHPNSVHFSEGVITKNNKQLPMKPPTPVVKPTAPQTLLRAMTLDISSAQGSIAGDILAYKQSNDEGRDLQGDPIECFKAMSDPATLYYHQATKEPDHKNFKYAMVKEVTDWKSNDNYDVVPTSEIPAGETSIPSVWNEAQKGHHHKKNQVLQG